MRRAYSRHSLAQREELALIALAQAGSEQAMLKLVQSQRGLVCMLARRWKICSTGLDLEDLIEYGILGLLKAIRAFDPHRLVQSTGKPHRLGTFAHRWIAGEIAQGIQQGMYTIRPSRDSYVMEHPTLSFEELVSDASIDGSQKMRVAEQLLDPAQFEDAALIRCALDQALPEMPNHRWPGLVVMRFGLDGRDPLSFREMGQVYGISGNHAQRETLRALMWLREYAFSEEATLQVGGSK